MKTEAQIQIPTDNLYKFLAIFSAVLIPSLLLLSFTVIATTEDEDAMKEIFRKLGLHDLVEEHVQPPPPLPSVTEPNPDNNNATVYLEAFDADEIEPQSRFIANLVLVFLGTSAGLLMVTLIGFVLWYVRLQRYQDKMIRIEALSTQLRFSREKRLAIQEGVDVKL